MNLDSIRPGSSSGGFRVAVFVGLSVFALACSASADLIRFWEGSELKGRVVKKTAKEIIVQFPFGKASFLPSEIEAIEPEAESASVSVALPAEPTKPSPAAAPFTPVPEPVELPESLPAPKEEAFPDLNAALKSVVFIVSLVTEQEGALGSGVVINAHGTILTNNHVIAGAKKILVFFPSKITSNKFKEPKSYEARVIKANPYYDLALIDVGAETTEHLSFADPAAIRVGEEVRVIGNPRGLAATVSRGVISAIRTNWQLGRAYQPIEGEYMTEREFGDITWIQTDASINQGNSGGPMINRKNEIIGINSWIISQSGGSEGLGFALHVKHLRKFAGGFTKKPKP